MKAVTIVAFVAICLAFPLICLAEAFGLEMGTPLEKLPPREKQLQPGLYLLKSVPTPHPAFESYVVKVGPTTGLCWVKGIGKDIQVSSYGLDLKSAFTEMKGKLDKVYGQSDLTDRLFPGSIWNEPKDWMMGLLKKERYLLAGWNEKSHAKLPANLTQVGLMANATRSDKGYISLEYYFSNKDACDAEVAKQADTGL